MTGGAPGAKRRYDNTRRREQANETRARIVAAGADLVRASSVGDWQGVTIRAVAERAGVNERTVYRHFAHERALRDAVMQELEHALGIDLATLELDSIADTAARLVRHLSSYPPQRRHALDPTLVEASRRQHDALLAAVKEHADHWTAADRTLAAAMLDVMWSTAAYQRLARDWNLDDDEAIRALTWMIDLIDDAIREDRRPPRAKRGRSPKEER